MKKITENHIVQNVLVEKDICNFTEYIYQMTGDRKKENDTAVEIFCDSCKEKYHYERNYGNDYLVRMG